MFCKKIRSRLRFWWDLVSFRMNWEQFQKSLLLFEHFQFSKELSDQICYNYQSQLKHMLMLNFFPNHYPLNLIYLISKYHQNDIHQFCWWYNSFWVLWSKFHLKKIIDRWVIYWFCKVQTDALQLLFIKGAYIPMVHYFIYQYNVFHRQICLNLFSFVLAMKIHV